MKTFHFSIVGSITFFLCGLSVSADHAQHWGHWRGQGGNSVSTTATPPVEWGESKNVKWKVPVPGRGSGSPVVWGDQIFVVSAVAEQGSNPSFSANPSGGKRGKGGKAKGKGKGGKGRGGSSAEQGPLQFKLFCFDRNTGELRWEKTAVEAAPHEGTHQTNTFASASPCTDGEHVYAHYGSRGLFCYDMQGNLKWSKTDFGKMQTRATFGEGSSPTLAGDKILVPWDHEGPSALYALNKKNGETLWKTEREEPTCWATPLVVEAGGGKHQVLMNGQTKARAYDLETGEELWSCPGQTDRPVASAVSADGLAFIGSGFRGSFLGAFKLEGQGDIENSEHVVWTTNDDTPDIASPLLSGGRLYFHKGKTGILTCLDAKTGSIHFGPERIPGVTSTYASPIAANGHVYLTDRSGMITVIKDAPTLEVVATNSLGEGVDATPAPVGEELFIRGANHLFCISHSQ